jgi:hypothetical protein
VHPLASAKLVLAVRNGPATSSYGRDFTSSPSNTQNDSIKIPMRGSLCWIMMLASQSSPEPTLILQAFIWGVATAASQPATSGFRDPAG